jgi:hypothetical protein
MSARAFSIGVMDFDQITVALLVLRPDAPELDDAASDALQDAHMAHLAQLHDRAISSRPVRCSVVRTSRCVACRFCGSIRSVRGN